LFLFSRLHPPLVLALTAAVGASAALKLTRTFPASEYKALI
jgi:hypothetical protein